MNIISEKRIIFSVPFSQIVYYDTRVRGMRLTQFRKSRSHVYRILFFKASAAKLDEIRQ